MRRSLTCAVFNVLLVYSRKQRFCLVSAAIFYLRGDRMGAGISPYGCD